MDVNNDYNATFKSISVKLKKRFLRKPNVSEAIEEYTLLGKQLENEECHGLSAYCLQQVAKCYHSVGNTTAESAALQTASKQYLNSECSSSIESNILTLNEDLLSSISVYEEAIKLHSDHNEKFLAAKLCVELGDILGQKFERLFEAIPYYEKAISLLSDQAPNYASSIQVLVVQIKLACLKVFTCDYSGALNTYTDICSSIINKFVQQSNNSNTNTRQVIAYAKPMGLYASFLAEADISKRLLLLYIKPTLKMKPEHAQTIEVYSWFQTLSSSNSTYLPLECIDSDLFILLQSFVMACQSNDTKLLKTLQTELWPHLNQVQNYILNLITDQLLNSSYTDDLLSQ
jgi:tetratricopeptide (TPR) repeat protein